MQSTECIPCPHCGYAHENWHEYVDTGDMDAAFDMPCDSCKMDFNVAMVTVVTFTTTTTK